MIADGGSTDATVEVMGSYPHLRWVSEPDEGQSDALNKALERVEGDVVGWLNADDYYLPGTFDRVAQIMRDAPEVDAVYADVRFVDQEGFYQRNLTAHRPVQWMSLFHCFVPSTTVFFRRRVIDAGLRMDKDMHISMDKDFFARMFYEGYRFRYLKGTYFAAFRWHDSNKSIETEQTGHRRHEEGLRIWNRYSGCPVEETPANVRRYVQAERATMVVRKLLKWTS